MEHTLSSRHRRVEHVSQLSPPDFVSRLDQRTKLFSRFTSVVQEAVDSGEIESWEYPEIESSLGIIAATVFGVPTPTDSLETALSARIPAMSGYSS